MRKALFIFVASALSLLAANFKLYLKDGTYQIVKEYKVDGDRLRYYSVERSDWEELPAALVDLRRTDEESAAKKAVIDRQAKELTAVSYTHLDVYKRQAQAVASRSASLTASFTGRGRGGLLSERRHRSQRRDKYDSEFHG